MTHREQIVFSVFVIAIVVIVVLPLNVSAIQHGQSNLQNQIDEYFLRLARENHFSGAVLVAQNGEILLKRGYGRVNESDGSISITPDTVFDIGSISKQFTAAAILRLEQDGLLNVLDRISEYFNDVPPDKAHITIHQLLTHSAGFTEDHFEDDLHPMTRDEAQQAIFSLPLGYQPGTDYHYSNTGYTLLAIIIEKVSGIPYTNYLRQTFFEPLGMTHTGFYNDNWSSSLVANTYFNGKDQGKPSDWPGPYWGVMGNGGVLSTVEDLYIWWQSLQNHSVLSPNQTEKLFARHISEGSSDSFYGYGWLIQDSPYGNLITHNGGGIGGNSDLAVYSDKNLIIIICSNQIVWRTLFGSIPYEIRLPATEAREQLAHNIFEGDFSKLPQPTFLLVPYLGTVAIIAIGVVSLIVFLFRRNRAP